LNIVQAAILGVVQGVTEFIPISSSAHLVLVPNLMGWHQPSVSFDVMLHMGTLVAVLYFFKVEVINLFGVFLTGFKEKEIRKSTDYKLCWLIIIGTVPAVVLALLFQNFFENLFSKPESVAFFLLGTGALLWFSETTSKRARVMEDANLSDALIIGLAQGCAIAPGISRSGATIAAGLFKGLDRDSAARFSFLLAIPIIFGAVVVKMSDFIYLCRSQASVSLLLGFLTAAASGYLCIKYFLNYLKKGSLMIFAYYCWFVGLAFILSKRFLI